MEDFKFNIGDKFKDDKKDLIIIDREYRTTKKNHNEKWYKYKCNKCGWSEGWISEYKIEARGCSCCCGRTVVKGINDISTTAPWMVKFFSNKNDAYKYTCGSNKKIKTKCPDCGNEKYMIINNLFKKGFSCNKCSDGFSYPNKFMFNVLEQLNEEFVSEYSPIWVEGKFYDFYIPSKKLIIEMDGGLGHGHKQHAKSKLTPKQSKEIDDYKDMKAIEHEIDVIRINCDYDYVYNRFEFIKSNILNSKLIKYYNLHNLNWDYINKKSIENRTKNICLFYNDNKNMTAKDISSKFKISISTLYACVKIGEDLGWCNYKNKKRIKIIETNDIFESITECDELSEKLYGIKLDKRNICAVLKGKRKSHKGFHFEYVD